MRRLIWLLVALAAFVVVFFQTSVIRIGHDQIGVRINDVPLLGAAGMEQRDFGPGWYLNLPVLQTWHVVPANVRAVAFTDSTHERTILGTRGGPMLELSSREGDRVEMDVVVLFRIRPGEGHRAIQTFGRSLDGGGIDDVALMARLAEAVQGNMQAAMVSIGTEDFYDTEVRQERLDVALEAANRQLAERNLEVLLLAVEGVRFGRQYESQIEEKKLTDQRVELDRAQARANREGAVVREIEIDTERQVRLIRAQAEAEAARIRAEAERYRAERQAEADLFRAQQQAEGQLALAQAEAEITRAKTAAMAGSGGANLAAMEAVRNLHVDQISFPTGTGDWFDVRQMAGRLGARP